MKLPLQHPTSAFHPKPSTATVALALLCASIVVQLPAHAQTYSVLHTFVDGIDGALPAAGLVLDPAGNLYGTAAEGGSGSCFANGTSGCGTIYELKQHDGSYIFNPLYSFQGDTDGNGPEASLSRGPNGTYYGTTYSGGGGTCGCGVVFNTGPDPAPPRTSLLSFRESVLYGFRGYPNDGSSPQSPVVFDQAGNMYGTTSGGGTEAGGTVFELSPAGGGAYTEKVLYNFCTVSPPPSCLDGETPLDGVVFDAAGNLYGTTSGGGANNWGAVFELSPSGAGWTERVIYSFQGLNDGGNPQSGVAIDSAGNLYGNNTQRGVDQGGTVYELSPNGSNWNLQVLYSQPFDTFQISRVTLDSSGNLYESVVNGGAGYGQVMELAHSGNNWTYIDLYNFTNRNDGSYPLGSVVLDSSGNLYGTAQNGGNDGCNSMGQHGCGVVWKITR